MKKLVCLSLVLCLFGCMHLATRDYNVDLRVYIHHRLEEPVNEIIPAFEAHTGLNVSARTGCVSSVLIPAIKKSREADVLITASPVHMAAARKAGVVNSAQTIAWNSVVLVVKKGNPLNIKSPEDLKKPGVRLVMPEPESGCPSRVANEIVEKWGLAKQASEAQHADMKCSNLPGLNMVAQGKADATFRWRMLAVTVDGVDIIPIQKDKGSPCECLAAVVKGAPHKENARKFLDFLKNEKAQSTFRKYGLLDLNEKAAK